MECRKPADVGRAEAARREARARWALEGWVRDLKEAEVGAVMRCAVDMAGDGDAARVEDLMLECAIRRCPIQPLAPRPVPDGWSCPGSCAALPPDQGSWGW